MKRQLFIPLVALHIQPNGDRVLKSGQGADKVAGIGDDAVQAKTGRTWTEWKSTLDAAGAKKMNHKEIVAYLHKNHSLGPWWQQMVTVGYEQVRGLREKHETEKGYQVSVSKTLEVAVPRLFRAWQNPKTRETWLAEKDLVVRKATKDKSMRITWTDQKTSVDVYFYPKGDTKSQVVVQHSKLPDAKAGARMKVYWTEALDRLKSTLAT